MTKTTFLAPEATRAQRIGAVVANHRAWFAVNSLARGGEVRHEGGATWVYTPGPNGEVVLPFPRIPREQQGALLDAILADCRSRGDVRQVSCWARTPNGPRGLGARLAARGFEYGWQAHWMGMDLRDLPAAGGPPMPDGLHVAVDDEGDWAVDDLPYYSRDAIPVMQARARPRRVWHFGARQDGNLVGHVVLHVTTGRLGAAGIYDLGVVPAARKRGVGRALMVAACRFAREMGCHHALLNSAATEFYLRLGWRSLGHGQTWWMHAPALAAPPSPAEHVAFAEAVGLGDLSALEALRDRQALPDDLDAPVAGGATPMALAVAARRPASARWLVAHGATLDILQAWDLGWKGRAARMLAVFPELANRRSGDGGITPLHQAVERGDVELARVLLAADPDLTVQDTRFQSTPLGWATHLGRTEIAALIEAHRTSA